jgi:D-glycero-D-manno-heptose 1,7-bisphosphate phosphatase
MNKAIFLDRDGVINASVVRERKPYPPDSLQELVIIEGVKEGLLKLKNAGYYLLIITNQPDVARGKTPIEKVNEIHNFMLSELAVDEVYCCFHDDSENCDCRKPKPGMILQATKKLNINLNLSFLVGDRWRDIEAGNAAGCTTYFIDYGYQERQPGNIKHRVASLEEAVENILRGLVWQA